MSSTWTLGVSSMQLDAWERGFSYSYDAPLDMRMDPSQDLSARDVVNEWPENRMAETLKELGEERHARSIAREIVARRPFETTSELVDAIRDAVPAAYRFGSGPSGQADLPGDPHCRERRARVGRSRPSRGMGRS